MGVQWFLTLLCLKELHRGLLYSSETNTAQSMRKAHQNCTNSLLKFKSIIKGGKITAVNSGMSLGLVIAFEVTLALDQGNLLCITWWWPSGMGGARWSLRRRVGRNPGAVAPMGVAEGRGVL